MIDVDDDVNVLETRTRKRTLRWVGWLAGCVSGVETCAAVVTFKPKDGAVPSRRPGYGTVASGTKRLTALASPLTSPSSTVTGTGGVNLKR